MKQNHINTGSEKLRNKAQGKLEKKYAHLTQSLPGSLKTTNEIWIHQIELEMQNEKLRNTQKELEDARQKYADLYNSSPLGYFIIDKHGIIKEANAAGMVMVGMESKNAVDQSLAFFISKEHHNEFHFNLRNIFRENSCSRSEFKMLKINEKKDFFAELIFAPIQDESNKIIHCRVAMIDITQRRKMELVFLRNHEELELRVKEKTADLLEIVKLLRQEIEHRKTTEIALQKRTKELEENEKKYRTFVEVSPEAICVVVADKIVFANNTAVKILHSQTIDDIIGKSFWQFVSPDSSNIIKERIRTYRSSERDFQMAEITLIQTEGTFIEVEVTAAPVDYETQKGFLIIFQDISLRRRQEAALRRVKYRLAEAQRIAHLGNWDWDIKHNSLWLSDESYKILGIEQERFSGKYESGLEALLKFVHPDDRQRVKQTIDESVDNCKAYDIEHRIITPGGIQRYVHKRAEVECEEGRTVRMVGTIQDITNQKNTEMQLLLSSQKLRTVAAKKELIEEQERRRIASDLHDSVGQILAFATRELKFMRKSLPQKQYDALTEIVQQLDKAVIQTRTLSFDLSPSILYDIGFEIAVEDLVEKFSNERKINGLFKNDNFSKPLSIPLKILLYRSIRELLMNIAKHANAKNIKVSLERKDNNIHVIVEDDGAGFDISEIDRPDKPKGFGLFSIRERIEHTGGNFMIQSARNKGTKTTLSVPLSAGEVNEKNL